MEGFTRGSNLRRGQGENKRGKCVLIGVHVIVSVQGRRGVSSKKEVAAAASCSQPGSTEQPQLVRDFFNPPTPSCLPQGLHTECVSVFIRVLGKPDT